MKVILASFLFFGLAWANLNCNCGWRNAGRIVGGKEAGKNEYPWIVAFQTVSSSWTFCGGAIVTPWHIITAAHCVSEHKASDLVVVVGAHDVNSKTEYQNRHLVERIIMHPSYDEEKTVHDLAIIVTSTEIKYNKFVGPACMPTEQVGDELVGQMLKAMGWGRYDPSKINSDRIKKLKEVDLEIISNRECRRSWPTVSYNQICTYTPLKDTCKGDSGGPLTWLDPTTNRFTLLGVVSYGPQECGKVAKPGVNTNVSAYLKWINDNILRTKRQAVTCHK